MTIGSGGSTTANLVPGKLRVVVADDHPDVLEEIRQLLNSEFDVVDAVGGGLDLVEAAARTRPDTVVSDISMPDLDGIEAGQRILNQGTSSAVVLLTMHNDPQLVQQAIEAGIRGVILKVDAGEELIAAVRAASRGSTYISRSIRTR
jgi:DNA-binding NarL/FixJ family response regulator